MVIKAGRTADIITLVLLAIIGHTCESCTNNRAYDTQVVIDSTVLRNGDLLLRTGYGAESGMVTNLSGGEYSHIAIAYQEEGIWLAVHAVPGETENMSDTDYLKMEPVELFYSPQRAHCGAIARVDCSDMQAQRAVEYAIDKVRRKFAFDHKYRLSDTTEYYCTELIHRAYLAQGTDLAENRAHELPMPGTEGLFIFPSDIIRSPHIEWIKTLKTIKHH